MPGTTSNNLSNTASILIVGAGPSGLALATALRSLNTPALLIDEQMEAANTSRAAVVQPRTLEVLGPLGVVPQLLAEGLKVPIFRVRDRDRTLLSLDFGDLTTAYPFALMCPQDRTEAILLARLRSLGGAVVRPVELTAIRPGPDGVEAEVAYDGSHHMIGAQWLVGCDGGHSRVREQAGISFEGDAYERELRFSRRPHGLAG
jgi:2-polyprenyl-6-methoxyphenol hydroxylase-like FAD-dependent oxidoreductase